MKNLKITVCFLVCLAIFSVSTNFAATRHRYHTSLTRIDYNVKEKTFEISIQLFTHDLVPLLEKRGGKRVELEKSPEADKLIFDYVNENFALNDKNGTAKKLRWVGKEFDVDSVEVYLETDAAENPAGYTLKNTLFFESFPEQTNIVICRYDGKKADLLYKVGDRTKEIVENKTAGE